MLLYRIREYLSTALLLFNILICNRKGSKNIIEREAAYGDNPQQHILFIMPTDGPKKEKLIFFVNGGAWAFGSASLFKCVGYYFASLGFSCILGSYRHAPKFTFPCQLEDVVSSLKEGIRIASGCNVYHNKIVLIGQSSGAQLCSLLAFSDLKEARDFDKSIISGVINLGGALNFSKCKNRYIRFALKSLMGTEKDWSKADPFNNISSNIKIPTLCIHGNNDSMIEMGNSISFVDKLNKTSPDSGEVLIVDKGLHAELLKIILGQSPESKKVQNWIENLP